ncbi:MAG: M67 family metallopeptidase, partial [Cyanobacteriota bacterium]
ERKLSRRHRFSIAPQVMLKAQKDARDRNLNIIGIYHSHTDHPAIPSEFDRAIAWSQYSYVIVSVQQGSACDFKSWSLDEEHKFQPEKIHTISL